MLCMGIEVICLICTQGPAGMGVARRMGTGLYIGLPRVSADISGKSLYILHTIKTEGSEYGLIMA